LSLEEDAGFDRPPLVRMEPLAPGPSLVAQAVDAVGRVSAATSTPCAADIFECEDGSRVTRHLPDCNFAPCPNDWKSDSQMVGRHDDKEQADASLSTASPSTAASASADEANATNETASAGEPAVVTVTVLVTPDPAKIPGLISPDFRARMDKLREEQGPNSFPLEPTKEDLTAPELTNYNKATIEAGAEIVRHQQSNVRAQEAHKKEQELIAEDKAKREVGVKKMILFELAMLLLLGIVGGALVMLSRKRKKKKKKKEEDLSTDAGEEWTPEQWAEWEQWEEQEAIALEGRPM